jgi:four helix bundle protein
MPLFKLVQRFKISAMGQSYRNKQLEERTLSFSTDVIKITRSIGIKIHNKNIIDQLLKSSSSISANYSEANAAVSTKDLINKIGISRKEIQETKFWLKLLINTFDEKEAIYLNLNEVYKESDELSRIFGTIYSKLKKKQKNN